MIRHQSAMPVSIYIVKNTATRNEAGLWYEEIACKVPNKHWPLTTVKRLQRKIVDNLPVEKKRKVIIKQKHSIISVKFC